MARNDEAVDSYHLTSFVCKTASFCIQLPSVTSFVCTRPAFCTRKLTLSRSWRSEGLHSWQLRQPTAKSKLREPFDVARAAYFVPMMRKIKNNRDFPLIRYSISYGKGKEADPKGSVSCIL